MSQQTSIIDETSRTIDSRLRHQLFSDIELVALSVPIIAIRIQESEMSAILKHKHQALRLGKLAAGCRSPRIEFHEEGIPEL
jgi:hypothetical protein